VELASWQLGKERTVEWPEAAKIDEVLWMNSLNIDCPRSRSIANLEYQSHITTQTPPPLKAQVILQHTHDAQSITP
jgi:hypothetical protein